MTAPDVNADVRAKFEAWLAREIAENGGVEFGADYRHWAEKGYRAAHADMAGEVRELVEADRAYDEAQKAYGDSLMKDAGVTQRAWNRLGKACERRAAALAKHTHQEEP